MFWGFDLLGSWLFWVLTAASLITGLVALVIELALKLKRPAKTHDDHNYDPWQIP